MKLYKDCKHLDEGLYCNSPKNGISPVNGEPTKRFAFVNRKITEYVSFENKITDNKIAEESCGPDANFFQPKCIDPKKWYQFWRLKDGCSMDADGYCSRCHYGLYPFI